MCNLLACRASPQSGGAAPLKKPPKWLQRPVSATFGFGGKLAMACEGSMANSQRKSYPLLVQQLVTEAELVQRAEGLEAAIAGSDKAQMR